MTSALERIAQGLASNQNLSLAEATKETTRYLLLDDSSSMSEFTASREERKIDALRKLVYSIRGEGIQFKQVIFGAVVELREDIPEPAGGTPLYEAMELAIKGGASRMAVVSDGVPNSTEPCLELARTSKIPIDTFYVGPRPHYGEVFMQQLAEASGGAAHAGDLGRGVKAIEDGVRKALLALPPAIAL